ncbi:membrane protein DedA with SNARE-associated domain [Catenuloplanes nepalensis]|uniref:Membrane protein DedA with SNARE-associated domain n=1 Tax=Catenuloplanes nepalensis TaxID=587533 RepID=A0ABT9N044_9ACTN|nr:DedA family protein [Catenuloplanes nepalensis]MDP9796626.1 membrane protein DedA with SNARE-associated domain [Catenuloplanes nepalensis]
MELLSVEGMIELLEAAVTSPWVYLAIFGLALLDAFFPAVPSETMVITAGVFAVSGEPNLALIIAAAAAGAFCGDHISYQIGRSTGLARRLPATGRRRAAFDWASAALQRRGGLLLVIARYIPGGRTAATLTMGACGYPRARFTLYDTIAVVSWALYSGLIGFLGGAAFEENKLLGVAFALGMAITLTVTIELTRWLISRRRAGAAGSGPESVAETAPVAATPALAPAAER